MIPIYDKKAFGEYLRKARVTADYNQNEIAKNLELTGGQFLSNIERGLCPPPPKILRKLIRLYGLKTDKLIKILLIDHEAYLKKTLK